MQDQSRTAIVTGAGKRVGAAIAAALVADGWAVVAHVHHEDDEVPDGATKVVAELADLACADTIFETTAGLPPVELLVNNAARFAHDDLSEFDPAELAAHMQVNLRAPILLTAAFARAHTPGSDALSSTCWTPSSPRPTPIFSATPCPSRPWPDSRNWLRGLSRPREFALTASLPRSFLRSPGQSEENFESHACAQPASPRRGSRRCRRRDPLLASARVITGEIITIDGGQRFSPPSRDVQFLEER